MLYMIVNRTRPNLTQDDWAELGRLAQAFYENVPAGLALVSDWAALDGSCTYALMETEDRALLDSVQAPFRPYVDMEVVPVRRVTAWGG